MIQLVQELVCFGHVLPAQTAVATVKLRHWIIKVLTTIFTGLHLLFLSRSPCFITWIMLFRWALWALCALPVSTWHLEGCWSWIGSRIWDTFLRFAVPVFFSDLIFFVLVMLFGLGLKSIMCLFLFKLLVTDLCSDLVRAMMKQLCWIPCSRLLKLSVKHCNCF